MRSRAEAPQRLPIEDLISMFVDAVFPLELLWGFRMLRYPDGRKFLDFMLRTNAPKDSNDPAYDELKEQLRVLWGKIPSESQIKIRVLSPRKYFNTGQQAIEEGAVAILPQVA